MRPQHITAENAAQLAAYRSMAVASMRPQHITAENQSNGTYRRSKSLASMRPQHITAENIAYFNCFLYHRSRLQ